MADRLLLESGDLLLLEDGSSFLLLEQTEEPAGEPIISGATAVVQLLVSQQLVVD